MKPKRTLTENHVDKILSLLDDNKVELSQADIFPSIEARIFSSEQHQFFKPKNLLLSLIIVLVAANAFAVGTSIYRTKNTQTTTSYSLLISEYSDDSTLEDVYNE